MFDLIVVIFFELLTFIVVAATVREWWRDRWNRRLLPIPAYVLAMMSFAAPYGEKALPPWIAGAVWLVIGVIVHKSVQRAAGRRQAEQVAEPEDCDFPLL